MAVPKTNYLVIGNILKPWGYRGDLKVQIVTAFPDKLIKHKTVFLGEPPRAFQVESARLHSGAALFKLVGIDTPEAAAKLRGQVVRIPEESAAPLHKNQYFQHQIVGLRVITGVGEPLGVVEEILETGANDVYVIRREDNREILIPAIKQVVKRIDLEHGEMIVELIEGLE